MLGTFVLMSANVACIFTFQAICNVGMREFEYNISFNRNKVNLRVLQNGQATTSDDDDLCSLIANSDMNPQRSK